MASSTTVSNFNYTGTNPNLTALVSETRWQSPLAVTPIDYYLQSGPDPYQFNDITNGLAWNSASANGFAAAADAWSAVANIDIRRTFNENDADIWAWLGPASEVDALGWAELPGDGAVEPLYMAFAYDLEGWNSQGLVPGGYGYLTVLHEMGHVLGLGHPHESSSGDTVLPGVTSPFDDYGTYDLNQSIYTIMSYNDGWPSEYPTHNPFNGFETYGYAMTPAALDIAAIQAIYGANMGHATGNDTYLLPDSNTGGTGWTTIWDAGGMDEISAEGSTRDFTIDLRAATLTGPNAGGFVSYSSGIKGGITIANGVTVEHATGGNGDDTVQGNGAANRLTGNDGNDSLLGGGGADTLDGGAGADVLNGGGGTDLADFNSAEGRVLVDLASDASGAAFARFFTEGAGAGDTFVEVENARGGTFADNLRGDASGNVLTGGGGWDRLYGRAGDDTLVGGNGADAIFGNQGADVLTGGSGAGLTDRFIYFNASETGVGAGNRDIITDFVSGEDRIELRRIDADVTQGFKQFFDFIGDAGFSNTAGELRYEQVGGNTIVQADRDGDGAADLEIQLTGTIDLLASDFFI